MCAFFRCRDCMTAIVFVVFLILYIIMTSVGSVGIGLVEDTTMEVDSVGQEDATYLERGMGAVGIGQQDENEVEQDLFDRMWQTSGRQLIKIIINQRLFGERDL